MDTIFMNSENSKASDPLTTNPTNKTDLGRGKKSVPLSNLSIYYTWTNIKSSNKAHIETI